jgi:hypothetical protein
MLSGKDSATDRAPRREFKPGMSLRNIGGMLRETCFEWNRERTQRMGASVAFYALLSLAPLLIILVTLAAVILGPQGCWGPARLRGRAPNRFRSSEDIAGYSRRRS